jgi:hypothetical protein
MTAFRLPALDVGEAPGRVIVQVLGGLGNQMFQYALGRAIAERTGARLLLDRSVIEHAHQDTPRGYDLDVFKLQPTFATRADVSHYHSHGAGFAGKIAYRLRRGAVTSAVTYQREFAYQPEILASKLPVYLAGYWQSYRYFAGIEDILRRDFEFRQGLPPAAADHAQAISHPAAICVHVRRGDYTDAKYAHFIGPCSVEYYRRAVARARELLDDPVFFIFSDDLAWCRENFDWLGSAARFMEYATPPGFKPHASDLQLMSRAQNFIIANSTFSWWAAWLAGDRANLVIAPTEWFKLPDLKTGDLIPDHWERL